MKVAVPLISHDISRLKICQCESLSSLESKSIGVDVTVPIGQVPARFFAGYRREHVEKLLLHKDKKGAITIISEDEAKRRGITLLS